MCNSGVVCDGRVVCVCVCVYCEWVCPTSANTRGLA